ncbi:MAG: F0F1 ATP synthase subunit epsilon [Gammaproteobacteria bacterium]
MTIQIDIVSAEGQLYEGEATMVFAPGIMGEIGIAPRHAPLLTALNPGEMRIQTEDGNEESFFVSGGIIEIQPFSITVLADTALRADDIDEAAAIEAQKRAEDALADQKDNVDFAMAQSQLAEAAARLKVVQAMKKGKGGRR